MVQTTNSEMSRYRAIMTDTDRRYITGEADVEKQKVHQSLTRVGKRIREELPQDVEILAEHHPGLLEELREAVCESEDK